MAQKCLVSGLPLAHGCTDSMHDFELLYQDDTLLVLNKPAELLSVPGRGVERFDSLQTRVQAAYPDALIVHRLDMSTSGIMVMARGKDAQRSLNKAFASRTVAKKYIAVVNGIVEPNYGVVDLPLITDWPNRPLQKVDYLLGKPSLTHYSVLSRDKKANASRLELRPQTGRSHQLRVHMMALGHTILGDNLYADDEVLQKAARLQLHAEEISFEHPGTGKVVHFSCEAPF